MNDKIKLIDYFAAKAMQALLIKGEFNPAEKKFKKFFAMEPDYYDASENEIDQCAGGPESLAITAYNIARYMIEYAESIE